MGKDEGWKMIQEPTADNTADGNERRLAVSGVQSLAGTADISLGRAALRQIKSVFVGILGAGLLFLVWTLTNAWAEESRDLDAGETNAFAILGAAQHQMGLKHSCGIENIEGYERSIGNLATFLGFDSNFHWQSPYTVDIVVSRQSKSGSVSSVSYVADAGQVAGTAGPDAGLVEHLCEKLRRQ